jgi:archaellum component FlaC
MSDNLALKEALNTIGNHIGFHDQESEISQAFAVVLAHIETLRQKVEQLQLDLSGKTYDGRVLELEQQVESQKEIIEAAKACVESFDDEDKKACRCCGEEFTSSYTAWKNLDELADAIRKEYEVK